MLFTVTPTSVFAASSTSTTKPTTTVHWCTEGGNNHVINVGIGWYSSYNEAVSAASKYASDNNISSGHFEIQECDCGKFTAYVTSQTIPEHTHTWDDGVITKPATCKETGSITYTCSSCGTKMTNSITTITKPSTFKLSATSYTYDGKAKKPSVTVKDSAGKTIAASNYTVSYASGRKKVGKYAVKITFKGNYSGTKTLYFTIKPKNTSITGLTSGSKKFIVKVKKYTTQTTGYQMQYATNSSFKSAKTVTMKNTTTSKTISKLAGKKKYYVRVRTYKTVNGTKYYSAWSKAKTITTKK